MRLATILLTLVLGALPDPARAQRAAGTGEIPARREFRHRETIVVHYHEASGYGAVELRPALLAASPEVRVRALFNFPGRQLAAPPERVTLALVFTSARARFSATPALTLLLDAAPVQARGVVRQVESAPDGVRETVSARLARETFLRLVRTERPVIVVDGVAVPVGGEPLEALRDLASRMSPAGYRESLAAHAVTERTGELTTRKVVYEARDVDSAARQTLLARPRFPAGVPRAVRQVPVEYVVDTLGRVELESLRGHSPADDAPFVAELRAVAPLWEFEPATAGGRRVRQLVRQVVVFDPFKP
jgi:hypothetical protein